jgi:hypothetical protein
MTGGRCPVCHRRWGLSDRGLLRTHGTLAGVWCPGSGRPPAVPWGKAF